MSTPTARVLIVEDEALFGSLLRRTLSEVPGVEVVGEAHDGQTAIRLANEARPDAIIMDIELEGELDGIDAALRIKQERPETGIVILSAHRNRRYVTSLPLDRSTGWAYLLKQSVPDLDGVVRAIQGSIAGMVVLDPAIVGDSSIKEGSPLANLTARQQQVLELIAQGYTNAAIATQLNLAEKTVEVYSNAIYQELGLSHQPYTHARVSATLMYLQESEDRT